MSATIALMVGAAATVSLVSINAQACGESLFRVGKGVTYRAQSAPLPGNVLMVASTEDAKGLAERLAAAGHRIHVVEDASLVAQALRDGEYDIVLAPFGERESIERQAASVATTATYLPVTLEASEEAVAAQTYERFLSADDSFTQFLRVIHRTLKEAQAS
jgi:hypothetical protein